MAGEIVKIDEINYHVVHEGPKDGPLVILCHALMANYHMWDATVPALHRTGYSTLRYDHIGHNKTTFATQEAATRNYHFDTFIKHIHELAKCVAGKTPFGFVGCSIGGVLAIRYAQLYPRTLSKIMSCDAPGMTTIEAGKPLWLSRIAQFETEGVENLAKATVERWIPEPYSEGTRDRMLDQTRTCTLDGYKSCAHAVMNYDYSSGLGQMENEDVLILAGENDMSIGPREILVKVAKAIPNAKYHLMANVGHIPPYHDPRGFNAIMIDFFES
ncbi:alpha/beta-hydrolase [Xylariaceae sp. FL0255]|nr:alpha/beta-hydrolase [Xylariaceae sp. FL0255]